MYLSRRAANQHVFGPRISCISGQRLFRARCYISFPYFYSSITSSLPQSLVKMETCRSTKHAISSASIFSGIAAHVVRELNRTCRTRVGRDTSTTGEKKQIIQCQVSYARRTAPAYSRLGRLPRRTIALADILTTKFRSKSTK